MNDTLYNDAILKLATDNPIDERLIDPQGTSERRSPICGSRVTVDVNLGPDGRVSEAGMLVRACALGQASSSLLAANVIGRTPAELAAARDALTAWLAREGELPDWPGLDVLTPALGYHARHASIRLAFEAAAEAAERAQDPTKGD
ncbi:iron-sulfur cluster assembly scaffold protein [Sphingomonas sp. IC-11]|uniref:iron-sulfur cluster assembly scaffold protein n=1 Tax=Sphingomonas sp. IC-11 TaxID=2898528 RepID=UPI001E4D03F4|nr:iron-sulfur cluster assembly scaffold protein [Sphingomonas sp. IC-11]MCD2314868.1 iron-sulfur cluster assembly scaffold protein [Sphingomonas sp. IC-11]